MQPSTPITNSASKNTAAAIDALCKIADTLYRQGKLSDSRQVLQITAQLLDVCEAQPRDHLMFLLQSSEVLVTGYFCTNSDADRMIETILQAKQVAEDIHDEPGRADALSLLGQARYYIAINNAASINSSKVDYDEALACQQEALQLRETLHDTRGMSESLFYIGVVYERRQQYDSAQTYYERVLQLAGQHGHTLEKCRAVRHLSGIACDRGDLEQALLYAQEALALRQKINFKLYLPFDEMLVGQIHLERKNFNSALLSYQHAYALACDMGLKQAILFSLLGLGDVHAAQKKLPQANAYFEQALTLANELGLTRAIAEVSGRLAALRLERQ